MAPPKNDTSAAPGPAVVEALRSPDYALLIHAANEQVVAAYRQGRELTGMEDYALRGLLSTTAQIVTATTPTAGGDPR